MKQIFEADTPPYVDVFESNDKITVKILKKPMVHFFGDAPYNLNACDSALDLEGIQKFKKRRSRPHRVFLLLALLAISTHVIVSLYVYQTADEIILILYSLLSIIPYVYYFENRWKIPNYLDQKQGLKNRKIYAKHGISEYNLFIDFDKKEKTIHPSFDKNLFSPRGHAMAEFDPMETQPCIDDCKPFPIDEGSIFVFDETRSFDIQYRYGLRQSKRGFYLRASNAGSTSNQNTALTAVLNEIIVLVRDGTIETEDQPFNPMD
jgi:hypothetical protein